jgi:hypothetical protein
MTADANKPPHEQTWPPLPLAEWRDTRDTLQRFVQIAGKIRMVSHPAWNQAATASGASSAPVVSTSVDRVEMRSTASG